MQDIVYKLVPNLQESKFAASHGKFSWLVFMCGRIEWCCIDNILRFFADEMKRERDFHRKRGLPLPEHLTRELTAQLQVDEEQENCLLYHLTEVVSFYKTNHWATIYLCLWTCFHINICLWTNVSAETSNENGLNEEDSENNNRSDDPTAYHRSEEQVNLYLESESSSINNLKRQFLR